MISEPQWTHGPESFVPPHHAAPAFVIECPTCGYEPPDQRSIHFNRCPKCHAFTWHRVPIAGRLLPGNEVAPLADA